MTPATAEPVVGTSGEEVVASLVNLGNAADLTLGGSGGGRENKRVQYN